MIKTIHFLMLASCIVLQGCIASGYVQDVLISPDYQRTQIYDEDRMLAIGLLKESDKTSDLLLLGEKYAYVIHQGGQELLTIIQQVPTEQRILMHKYPILFSFDSETKFRGILQFRYATPLDQIPKQNQQKLKQLGFNQKLILDDAQGNRRTYLYASIAFNGTQYQGISTDSIQHKMSQPYPIQIAKTITQKREKNKVQGIAGALLMPLAIGVDIITFPIAFGVVTYGLTHSQTHK